MYIELCILWQVPILCRTLTSRYPAGGDEGRCHSRKALDSQSITQRRHKLKLEDALGEVFFYRWWMEMIRPDQSSPGCLSFMPMFLLTARFIVW